MGDPGALGGGEARLDDGGSADELELTETTLTTLHGPGWRMLVIGAGQMSQVLAQMAQLHGYEGFVCGPRDEYASGFDVAGATLLRTMPDDTVTALAPDGHMAIVALTHDPKLDDLALMEALKSSTFYVGAIGSRLNQSRRRQRLKEHIGLTDEQLARLHGPVGLKNGARTPAEIAVSILAELTAVRFGDRVPEPVAVREASGWEWAARGERCVGGRAGRRPAEAIRRLPTGAFGAGAIGVSSAVLSRRLGDTVLRLDPATS